MNTLIDASPQVTTEYACQDSYIICWEMKSVKERPVILLLKVINLLDLPHYMVSSLFLSPPSHQV